MNGHTKYGRGTLKFRNRNYYFHKTKEKGAKERWVRVKPQLILEQTKQLKYQHISQYTVANGPQILAHSQQYINITQT